MAQVVIPQVPIDDNGGGGGGAVQVVVHLNDKNIRNIRRFLAAGVVAIAVLVVVGRHIRIRRHEMDKPVICHPKHIAKLESRFQESASLIFLIAQSAIQCNDVETNLERVKLNFLSLRGAITPLAARNVESQIEYLITHMYTY